jgi:eukaryotic-like serine/threonine-protein kinase
MPGVNSNDLIGSLIAEKYLIESFLGEGGMGVVYAGKHITTERPIAVKLLHRNIAGNHAARKRFLQEARAAARFNHPNVVEVLDVGEDESGTAYLILEYLKGESLADLLEKREKLEPEEALRILLPIMDALVVAHEQGIIHRDLKPANIFLHRNDTGATIPKLLDFGIAKVVQEAGGVGTATGEYMGTFPYMSPEQISESKNVTPAADVWSMGVVLYECLSGRLPFYAETIPMVIKAISDGQYPKLDSVAPKVPISLVSTIERVLTIDGSERLRSMNQFIDLLVASALREGIPLPFGFEKRDSLLETNLISSVSKERSTQPAKKWPLNKLLVISGVFALLFVIVGYALSSYFLGNKTESLSRAQPGDKEVNDKDEVKPKRVDFPNTKTLDDASGTIAVKGAKLKVGSEETEWRTARAWCSEVLPRRDCPLALFQREAPAKEVDVASFSLDRTEVSYGLFAAWLSQLAGLDFRREKNGPFIVYYNSLPVVALYDRITTPTSGLVRQDNEIRVRDGFAEQPVAYVTWYGAESYCRSRKQRLPTEEEWEFSARGTPRRTFPWGDDRPTCSHAVSARAPGLQCSQLPRQPVAVGTTTRDKTPEGVLDLGGNVGEWTSTVFIDQESGTRMPIRCVNPSRFDPRISGAAVCRVFKGGDWTSIAERTRSAGRNRAAQDKFFDSLGFRCAGSYP